MFVAKNHVFRAPAGEEGGAAGGADAEAIARGDVVVDDTPATPPVETPEAPKDGDKAADKAPAATEKREEPENRDEKGRFVPRERFNEAVEKEREKAKAAAARAAELESQLAAQATSKDIVDAQKVLREYVKERNSLLSDGKLDQATELDNKIFELQEAIAERKAEIKAETFRTQAVETMKYDTLVERLELEHPEINPDADEYDEDAAMELRALMRGYQTELKLSPAAALQRAAKRFFVAKAAPAKEAEPEKAKEEGLRRKQEAAERNVDAAKAQPPSNKDVGLDHDKKGGGLDAKTIMSMKYDEFVKLGDDVLSRLRGDTL